MAWTTPITWAAGDIVTSLKLNAHIRDNENFLLNQKQIVRATYNTSGNPGLTTVGSWALADSTNISVGLTTAFVSGRVWVSYQFVAAISGPTNPLVGMFDIKADDGTYLSSGTTTPLDGFAMLSNATGDATLPVLQYSYFNLCGFFTGLSAGVAHTFKLAYKIIGASNIITLYLKNTGRASGAVSSMIMFAQEV